MVGILRRSYGLRHCDVEPVAGRTASYGAADHRFASRLHPCLASIAGHQVTPSSDLEESVGEVLFYTILREPVSRVASQYQHVAMRSNPPPLEEVLPRSWWNNRQTRQLAGVDDVEAAVDVIRAKNVLIGFTGAFDEFLIMLRAEARDPRLDIRYVRRNISPDHSISRRILEDPSARRQIEEHNRNDLELWRVVQREIYPRQRSRFPGLERDLRSFLQVRTPPARSPRELLNRVHRNMLYKPALESARRWRHSR